MTHAFQASKLAAAAVPVVAGLAGAIEGPLGQAAPGLQSFTRSFGAIALLVAGCAWLWLDAKERKYKLRLLLFFAIVVVPVLAVPYYFNETRERDARTGANTWFALMVLASIGAYWLGALVVGSSK